MEFNFLTSKKDGFLKKWFKLFLFFALIVSMVLSSLSFTFSANSFIPSNKEITPIYTFAGAGTYASPYKISTANDLFNLSRNVNSGTGYSGKYFKLLNNINLNNQKFTPIGDSTNYFKGTFDGDNHIIEGLNINATTAQAGLFGGIYSATIKNIIVSGSVKLTPEGNSKKSVGGIAGYAHSSTFYNCSNRSNVELDDSNSSGYNLYAGGIVGYVFDGSGSSTTIELCKNLGKVTIYSVTSADSCFAGGICGGGGLNDKIKVLKSCNYGEITAERLYENSYAGGISGGYVNSITNCYNMGNIISRVPRKQILKHSLVLALTDKSTNKVSRIAESMGQYSIYSPIYATCLTYEYNNRYVPKNIFVTGCDNSNAKAGGICGEDSTSCSISNCYNYGDVSGGKKYVEINISFILQYDLPYRNGFYNGTYYGIELWLDIALGCYAGISYGSIGAVDCSSGSSPTISNCYYCRNAIANPTSTLESKITTLGYYEYITNNLGVSREEKNNYLKSGYNYSKKLWVDNMESTSITHVFDEDYFEKGSNLKSISIQFKREKNNSIIINIPIVSTNSSKGWILSADTSTSDYKYPYKYFSDNAIGVKRMYANSIPSGFSSDIWATSPTINYGYPYLKEMYW